MYIALEFDQEWALFLLTIPGSRLWQTERARRMIGAVHCRVVAAKPLVLKALSMCKENFDELASEVVLDQIFDRFHVHNKSLYEFNYSFIVAQFRGARQRAWRQMNRVDSSFDGEMDRYSGPIGDDLVSLQIDASTTIGWTKDDQDLVAQIVYGDNADATIDLTILDEVRRKLVGRAGPEVSPDAWDCNQKALDLYLQGHTMKKVGDTLGLAVSSVHLLLWAAYQAVAKWTGEDAEAIHDFAERWSKRLRSRVGAGKSGKVDERAGRKPESTQIDWDRVERWERFFETIMGSFTSKYGPHSWQRGLVRRAPVRSIEQLVDYVQKRNPRSDPIALLQEVLTEVHDIAMDIFRSSRPSKRKPTPPAA